ncbi:ATP-dependent DNA helicase, RecQ-like [Oceanospirillum multiglobuliferum]|uniref:ATP-dependent DNA helicase RecQ n=1 Tax=Oceanospirillum multiglobuliferum TaxID=64969 RepID=A0A1T4KFX5_9GAMM|nr:RecQ family ATP-dependent DNA helicase [Oceanospirillum multiglobuliferum]OPX56020.1 recombinase RecQ [Oceanospirillum multiglobuliferum]SJZ41311.1 ATP-dependent DNA helicase, RecQ-like [Oceanospirillum multiglobuliferum]
MMDANGLTPDHLNTLLAQQFGFSEFRGGQQQTVMQLLAGQSSLAIFPTGSGKSLCYQFTALQLPHLTLVVSPLLALMKDQLAFLASKGIAAASIDSTLSTEQHQQVIQEARSGKLKILMVSVERFKNERFRQFIESIPLSMLVVDEAHCISEWGHNFRPDYLKLPEYRQQLNIPLVLLLTATATRRVKKDMAQKFNIAPEHIVQTGFYRANLDLSVQPLQADQNPKQVLRTLIQHKTGDGIVYVTLQHTAEEVARDLCQQGIQAEAYHAGLPDEQRQKVQADFMAGRVRVVVATIAFGMGIDKPNIRFVIHYDLPKSIENYSQEIGRAGRDGLASDCITLASLDGIPVLENFVYGDTPQRSDIARLIEVIQQDSFVQGHDQHQWELQLNSLSNQCNIRQLPLKTLLVQLELMGILEPLRSYFAEYKYKLVAERSDILARFSGERAAFLNSLFEQTEFKRTWGVPHFDNLYQTYGAERHRAIAALDYLHEQGLIELSASKMTEVFRVNMTALNHDEPVAKLYHYVVEKEQKEIERIGALIRFFQLDRCLTHNLSRYFDEGSSPTACGHCSVCRGQVAHLSYVQPPIWPEDAVLKQNLEALLERLNSEQVIRLQRQEKQTLCARFLAGLTQPLFTQIKARQLAGFGSCELLRYPDIEQKVQGLLID